MDDNVLRIYEVRLNEISNYKQMLVGVSCIYAVYKLIKFLSDGMDTNKTNTKFRW